MTLPDSFWRYVDDHSSDNPNALRLAAAGKQAPFDVAAAIVQIEARRKFGVKLRSTLASFGRFYFPSLLAGEQSTSDLLAEYHASLVPEGAAAVDLTAGLGIDALHLAARAAKVVAVERKPELVKVLRYNAHGLGVDNLEAAEGDCRELVRQWAAKGRRFDVAFIDPARRSADGGRVFGFADCEPDLPAMLPDLQQICRKLIIKASPMLDVHAAVLSLGLTPAAVIALGTPTECKELDFVVVFDEQPQEPELKAVTVRPSGTAVFAFTRSMEMQAPQPPVEPAIKAGDTVYEPYPAVMKLLPVKLLAATYGLCGFGPGTNLLYSERPAADGFPGRTYKVEAVLPYASKVIKRLARQYPVAEVAVRNFGMTAEALRKRLGVRDGADAVRIFGVSPARLLVIAKSK